ncbi:MAG TPA: hypothetical protein VFF40_05025 [Acidimicrobiia bacterium]|nr:hypothetical protein [Acidimicrobiia bacterium]
MAHEQAHEQTQETDRVVARSVLGVSADSPWADVRAQYLRLVRRHHPDGANDLAESGRRTVITAEITAAYAVLLTARDRPADPVRRARSQPTPSAWAAARVSTDTVDDSRRVLLDAPFGDAFLALLEVAHLVGDVSYVDRLSGVLEVIVTFAPTQATSLLIYLETSQAGITEAVLSVEPLGVHPPAPLDPLVDRVAILLATQRPPAPD